MSNTVTINVTQSPCECSIDQDTFDLLLTKFKADIYKRLIALPPSALTKETIFNTLREYMEQEHHLKFHIDQYEIDIKFGQL